MRQSNQRNQRSRGLRVKHYIQLFLLTAVSVWLLYQLNRSYGKKLDMEEHNSTNAVPEGPTDFSKLGRKDPPHNVKMSTANEDQREYNEHEVAEGKETKQETKDEAKWNRDNEILVSEEQDQSKATEEHEGEHGEESVSEESNIDLVEGAVGLDEEEHEGDAQKAHEEHYKRDDASSAVRSDAKIESGNQERVQSLENDAKIETSVQAENASQANVSTPLGEHQSMPTENILENGTSVENKESNAEGDKLGAPSLLNSTSEEFRDQQEPETNSSASAESYIQMELQNDIKDAPPAQIELQNITSDIESVTSRVAMQNESVIVDSPEDTNVTIDTATIGEDKTNLAAIPDSNATVNTSSSTAEDKPNMADNMIGPMENTSVTAEADEAASNTPTLMSDNNEATQGESRIKNGDIAEGEPEDPADNTVAAEATQAHTDLSTLPSIVTEAMTSEIEVLV